jgi:hypothetical protein
MEQAVIHRRREGIDRGWKRACSSEKPLQKEELHQRVALEYRPEFGVHRLGPPQTREMKRIAAHGLLMAGVEGICHLNEAVEGED